MAKGIKTVSKKIIVTHPRTGTERNFDASIYEPFKAAVIQSLQGSKGKTFTEVTDDVVKIIKKKMPGLKDQFPGTRFLSGLIWRREAL
jgi:hypothetical protein